MEEQENKFFEKFLHSLTSPGTLAIANLAAAYYAVTNVKPHTVMECFSLLVEWAVGLIMLYFFAFIVLMIVGGITNSMKLSEKTLSIVFFVIVSAYLLISSLIEVL